MKFKVNDLVMVISGKDKGKSGKITKIDSKNNRVTVEKVNMRVKHVKKTYNKAGEKITFEASLSASNVMAVDPKTGKPTRIKHKKLANGKKERVTTKSNVSFDNVTSSAAPKTTKKKAK
jgi:large subunit ribosomal protein L24